MIRAARTADHPAIAEINTLAFGQPDEAGLIERLREAGDVMFELVMEEAGTLQGHILLSRLWADNGQLYAALAPMAVRPAQQTKGIGSALVRASLLYTGSYNPVPGVIDRWEHRPGVELRGNRYTLATHISTRPGGSNIDGLSMQLDRRAVDAKVSLTFDFLRDDQGNVYDRRWGASITFP